MLMRTVQNQKNLKTNNLKLVLDIIRDRKEVPLSRADIAKITQMSATSITRITDYLIHSGLVEQVDTVGKGTVGRNGIGLQVIRDSIVTAGISIDSDYIDVCLLDFWDEVMGQRKETLAKRPYTPEEILKIARKLFDGLCSDLGFVPEIVSAVGISCIGNIDYKTGTIFFAPQFQWNQVELGKLAKMYFTQQVYVENDMKSSIVGLSRRDQDLKHENITYLSIGMGVGAAVMYDGVIMRGSNNAAGEVGHIIVEAEGRACDCGQRGCVQTYLTKNSLIEICGEKGHPVEDVQEIYEAYRKGSPWAAAFVDKTVDHLAVLMRNLVYMYDTRYLLVGGAIISDFPEMFTLAKGKLKDLMHSNLYSNLRLKCVMEKYNSMIGAAFVAQENSLEQCGDGNG